MNIYVLNTSIELVGMIDEYDSCIWTDRYNEAGDFELILPVSKDNLDILKMDYYLTLANSEHVMIIEKLEFKMSESGYQLVVSGESLESILKRRIVYSNDSTKYIFEKNKLVRYIIKALLDGTCSRACPDNNRKIDNLFLRDSSSFNTLAISEDVNFLGNNLYDTVSELCKAFNIGFRITLDTEAKRFYFELYSGVDRSYAQTDRPYVVFSNKYGNIISANYTEDNEEYKNTAYIAGKENNNTRPIYVYPDSGQASGLNRREIFVDANNIEEDYLLGKGQEELKSHIFKQEFDGEVDPDYNYVLRTDYQIGDIVQYEIVTEEIELYQIARIKEIIYSHDESGYIVYPTFEIINEEG